MTLPESPNPPSQSVIASGDRWKTPLLIGTATLGIVRFEWHNAMMHMILPVNLSSSVMIQPYNFINPMNYHVAEAQNLIVKEAIDNDKYEWIFFIEDDVVVPPNILLQWAKWMADGRFPVVSGWYNVKSTPPQPMFFRGRGNGPVCNHPGEVEQYIESINEDLQLKGVFCDGLPTGCILISTKLLKLMWDKAPSTSVTRMAHDGSIVQIPLKEVFKTTRDAGIDPETGGYYKKLGTSDLEFCDRILDNNLLKEAGFEYASTLEHPFPVDTDIRCGHIDLTTGVIY